MDKEFKKWMKWYGKKHGEYTVSSIYLFKTVSVGCFADQHVICRIFYSFFFLFFLLFLSAGER